jgi:hypothetical protein
LLHFLRGSRKVRPDSCHKERCEEENQT